MSADGGSAGGGLSLEGDDKDWAWRTAGFALLRLCADSCAILSDDPI